MAEETNETTGTEPQVQTPATPEQPAQPAAEAVAPEAPAETQEQPETPTAQDEQPKEQQETAEDVKKGLKVTVGTTPQPKKEKRQHPVGSFNPNDAAAKKAWVAQKHKEQQESLIKNGYTPTAVLSIMRYMTQNHGYEKQRAKDHLIYMFERFARSCKYSLDIFDRNTSSLLAVLLIDISGHLNENHKLLDLPPEESQKFVMGVIDKVWKNNGGYSNKEISSLKQHLVNALHVKSPEGYAARAMYFIECIVDTTMKMVDPFEGMFHTEKLDIPQEMREIMHLPPKGQKPKFTHPKKMCPVCGKPMRFVFSIKKHFCNNPLCTEYKPKPPRRDNGEGQPQRRPPEKISKSHQGGYDSGKPIEQTSASDKFRQKYGKGRVLRDGQTVATSAPKETKIVDGKKVQVNAEFKSNSFDALDKLKLPETPAAEAK